MELVDSVEAADWEESQRQRSWAAPHSQLHHQSQEAGGGAVGRTPLRWVLVVGTVADVLRHLIHQSSEECMEV